jgi:hypothetical protein
LSEIQNNLSLAEQKISSIESLAEQVTLTLLKLKDSVNDDDCNFDQIKNNHKYSQDLINQL